MGPQELSNLLWKERDLLEMLLFKLEEEQLLLTSGRTRWMPHATREVQAVMEKVRATTLARSVAAQAVAETWGLDPDATLSQLAAAADESGPWREIFTGHLTGLAELAANIKQVRDTNAMFVKHASRSTQETLASLTTQAGTYDSKGAARTQPDVAQLFDTTL